MELKNLAMTKGLYFNNIFHEPIGRLCVEDSDNGEVTYIYDWVGVYYSSEEGALPTDYMGFGMYHIMREKIGEIESDEYSDVEITGIKTKNYNSEIEKLFEYDSLREKIKCCVNNAVETLSEVSATTLAVGYSVENAVNYAHQYCGFPGASSSGVQRHDGITHDTYYNNAYANYNSSGGDCANFVSQCLYAGGLSINGTWQAGSDAWIRVSSLKNYLVTTLGYQVENANNSNTYPGNVVYWLVGDRIDPNAPNTNHAMICTGKNSAGVPVIDAHNSDCYRVPITFYSSKYNLHTIKLVNSYTHYGNTTSIGASSHNRLCKTCSVVETLPHTLSSTYNKNSTGHAKYCTECGYVQNYTAHSLSSSYYYNSSSHWLLCNVCGYKKDVVGHNFVYSGSYKTCRVCGYKTNTNNGNSVNDELS